MRFHPYPLCFLAMLFLFPQQLSAHGVTGSVAATRALCARFHFDDVEPMSYAEVTILLSGEKLPFQKGRTDAEGRFCFYPGKGGTYRIKATDGMGHALELSANADTGNEVSQEEKTSLGGGSKWRNALTGVALIFGLCGLIAMFRKRRDPPVAPG